MLSHDPGADKGGELGRGSTLRVLRRKLQDRHALARTRVLPHLADLDRPKVGLSVGVGMGHGR
jgi:hypothetical protein